MAELNCLIFTFKSRHGNKVTRFGLFCITDNSNYHKVWYNRETEQSYNKSLCLNNFDIQGTENPERSGAFVKYGEQ